MVIVKIKSHKFIEEYGIETLIALVFRRDLSQIKYLISNVKRILGEDQNLINILEDSYNIIDVGPGLSTYSWELAKEGKIVKMVEKNEKLCNLYRAILEERNLEDDLLKILKETLNNLDINPKKLNIRIIQEDFWKIVGKISGDLAIISYVMNYMGEKEFLVNLRKLYEANISNILVISPRDSKYIVEKGLINKKLYVINYSKRYDLTKLIKTWDKKFARKTSIFRKDTPNYRVYILLISKTR